MTKTYSTREQFVKRFIIDLGLLPGYAIEKTPHTIEEVTKAYLDWQKQRLEKNLLYFSGIVTSSSFVYAFKKDGDVKGIHEPAVRIEGEVNMENHSEMFNDNAVILGIISDLARYVGEKAEQERVHVYFDGKYYLLEVEKTQ